MEKHITTTVTSACLVAMASLPLCGVSRPAAQVPTTPFALVDAQHKILSDSVARNDASAVASLYAEHAAAIHTDMDKAHGREGIATVWHALFDPRLVAFDVAISDADLTNTRLTQSWKVVIKTATGQAMSRGTYQHVWMKDDGVWDIQRNIITPEQPLFQNISQVQLLGDFRIFREALEQGHPGIYRYTAKSDMDRLFHDAELSLSHPMDGIAFYRTLVRVVAAIKCGHTGLTLPSSFSNNLLLLPLRIRVLDNHIYVTRDLITPDAHLEGSDLAGS